MSTAALFVEAVDTLIVLIHAAFGWLIFLAVTASMLALAAVACGAWAVDLAWGRLYRLARGRDAAEATPEPNPQRRARRRVPSWAQTQPLDDDFEEAA
jgi:hypothetical protein